MIPGQLTILASSPTTDRALGHATILSGSIPDFFLPNQPGMFSIAFGLAGVSRIEVKKGEKITEHVVRPGGFSITHGWGVSAVRNPQRLETLNLGLLHDQLVRVAEREFSGSVQDLELVECYQKTHPEIVGLGQAFNMLMRSPRSGGGLSAETLWTQIVLQLLWNCSSVPKQADRPYEKLSDSRVQRVVDYLQSSYSEEASLKDMAAMVGLTPNYFLNAFKKATGKTPHRYLRDFRMEKARELLANPQLSILNVALAVGYPTQSHFTNVFSKEMGITPAQYRVKILGLKH